MFRSIFIVLVVFQLTACFSASPEAPKNKQLESAIAQLYLSAGAGFQNAEARVLGKHYAPGDDAWRVIACTNFTLNERESSDCNDSFNALILDTERWIVNGRVNGIYRWIELAE